MSQRHIEKVLGATQGKPSFKRERARQRPLISVSSAKSIVKKSILPKDFCKELRKISILHEYIIFLKESNLSR